MGLGLGVRVGVRVGAIGLGKGVDTVYPLRLG